MRRRTTMMRVAVGALAVVLAAWFGLVGVQARDADVATNIISGPAPSAARARQARDLLDTAAILSPDREIDLLRGQLAHVQGHDAQARRLVGSVTRAEPDNAEAWLELIRVSTGPQVAGELRHYGSLAPTVRASS